MVALSVRGLSGELRLCPGEEVSMPSLPAQEEHQARYTFSASDKTSTRHPEPGKLPEALPQAIPRADSSQDARESGGC